MSAMLVPGAAAADTQERFLRAIAARIDPALVVEVHLFPPIRQGGIESGVAVIAAAQPVVEEAARGTVVDDTVASIADAGRLDEQPVALDDIAAADIAAAADADDIGGEHVAQRAERFTVYTAHYRHVLKGPDRGQWEADAIAEADAPLATVDAVVRGVQRRAGEAMDAERLSGDAFRAAIGFDVATRATGEG